MVLPYPHLFFLEGGVSQPVEYQHLFSKITASLRCTYQSSEIKQEAEHQA